ncbi:hypothetical protein [uncultured Maricaulis sp.]|uniref:hypothetical protein n=1 Tax=uncultured Maricaulis sp. TaxID=174710 RepID=UPI0030DCF724|tara:strand:- start:66321 stop:66824 length:504 start_codon:yes stop_codon:yes gene_type:complete
MADIENDTFREAVKERHGFADWASRAKAADVPPRVGFLLDRGAMTNLEFLRRDPLPGGGGFRGHRDYFQLDGGKDNVVAIELLETPSTTAAHEALVDILSHCMAMKLIPAIERGVDAGHVGFVGHGKLVDSIYFVRGSTLVRIDSVGSKPVDVGPVAQTVDRQLMGR